MDTLAKYPQLQPTFVHVNTFQSEYSASVDCEVYYENVRVVNHYYRLLYPLPENTVMTNAKVVFDVDTHPGIPATEAISLAREQTGYDKCLLAELVIFADGRGTTVVYKLVWDVYSVASGQFVAGIDAHTGKMIFSTVHVQ